MVRPTSSCLSDKHANLSEFKLHLPREPVAVLALAGCPQTHSPSLKRQIETRDINSFYLQEH